ncbi:MAG: methyltransferase domain-containing protein [Candidatus Hydrogenedentes bacterium]|nr:methyltransferase domain-containing protein [Candidatus Hydrogenedentota bacterium]
MKRVVVSSGLHEQDIRPPALMSEFKRLSIHDAAEYFADKDRRVAVNCVACGSDAIRPVFNRYDFLYNECMNCHSVFVSPRPSEAALDDYYATSRASRFRVEHFSRDTARARRYHLLQSHANWMGQIFDETGNRAARSYADFNTYSPEIFEEMALQKLFEKLYTIDPLLEPKAATSTPVETVAEGKIQGLGAISAFEKIEHQYSPLALLESMGSMLVPGGLFFFTTRTITGFDLQILWDKTPYIFVPEHLNLLSVAGIRMLVERAGLELVELSTPGQLDLQLVKHASEQDPSIQLPRFVELLLRERDALAHEDFQAFLQKHRLSSHVRVAARKPME